MIVEVQVTVSSPKESIWKVVTDKENVSKVITGIEKVEILERPESGLVGLKWRETRKIFGKEATEDMWVTEVVENELLKFRAESHGSIFQSTIHIAEQNGACSLTMTHESEPQSLMAKLISIPMSLAFKGMMKKVMLKDLNDIKQAIES
ncbi:MAG: SRPBCC family protein [Planctomycetes bacterium]|nr:SRPBCC family protein [Planctomycetota bacterium]